MIIVKNLSTSLGKLLHLYYGLHLVNGQEVTEEEEAKVIDTYCFARGLHSPLEDIDEDD